MNSHNKNVVLCAFLSVLVLVVSLYFWFRDLAVGDSGSYQLYFLCRGSGIWLVATRSAILISILVVLFVRKTIEVLRVKPRNVIGYIAGCIVLFSVCIWSYALTKAFSTHFNLARVRRTYVSLRAIGEALDKVNQVCGAYPAVAKSRCLFPQRCRRGISGNGAPHKQTNALPSLS